MSDGDPAGVPEPASQPDLRELLLAYLDCNREVVISKAQGIPAEWLDVPMLPSEWQVAGLLKHLQYMERRSFVWGFLGEAVDDPWGDQGCEDDWDSGWEDLPERIASMRQGGARTRAIGEAHDLGERAATGGLFATEEEAPHLQWILMHVLQEYARHAGHLDIVKELIDHEIGAAG